MDLDRRVSEVLGARFGGGGAAGEEPIRLQLVIEHTHTYAQFCFNSNRRFIIFLIIYQFVCLTAVLKEVTKPFFLIRLDSDFLETDTTFISRRLPP